jgi:hypothetical protein
MRTLTGAEFVGAGQVIRDAVSVRVPVTPGPVTVCVGPVIVIISVIIVVTPGWMDMMVVPPWVIVKVLPGRIVGVVTVITFT